MKEGEPAYIVTRFDNGENGEKNKSSETEKINQTLAGWENEEAAVQNEILPKEERGVKKENNPGNQEIKIEDLPF